MIQTIFFSHRFRYLWSVPCHRCCRPDSIIFSKFRQNLYCARLIDNRSENKRPILTSGAALHPISSWKYLQTARAELSLPASRSWRPGGVQTMTSSLSRGDQHSTVQRDRDRGRLRYTETSAVYLLRFSCCLVPSVMARRMCGDVSSSSDCSAGRR